MGFRENSFRRFVRVVELSNPLQLASRLWSAGRLPLCSSAASKPWIQVSTSNLAVNSKPKQINGSAPFVSDHNTSKRHGRHVVAYVTTKLYPLVDMLTKLMLRKIAFRFPQWLHVFQQRRARSILGSFVEYSYHPIPRYFWEIIWDMFCKIYWLLLKMTHNDLPDFLSRYRACLLQW